MDNIKINEYNYEILKNYRDGFVLEEVVLKLTDYFEDYDYILGDWAYGKLRLKGFNDSSNPKVKDINDYKNIDSYLEEFCAKNCRYFVIKKID